MTPRVGLRASRWPFASSGRGSSMTRSAQRDLRALPRATGTDEGSPSRQASRSTDRPPPPKARGVRDRHRGEDAAQGVRGPTCAILRPGPWTASAWFSVSHRSDRDTAPKVPAGQGSRAGSSRLATRPRLRRCPRAAHVREGRLEEQGMPDEAADRRAGFAPRRAEPRLDERRRAGPGTPAQSQSPSVVAPQPAGRPARVASLSDGARASQDITSRAGPQSVPPRWRRRASAGRPSVRAAPLQRRDPQSASVPCVRA